MPFLRAIFVYLLCIISLCSHAKVNRDSLEKASLNPAIGDSLRCDALIRLSISYKDNDLPLALQISNHAISLADSTANEWLIVRAQDNHATILKFKGDYKEAEALYLSATKKAEEMGDTLLLSGVYGHLGTYYQAVEQNQLAILYLLRSLKIDQARGEDGIYSVAATLNNIGNVYYSDKNFDQALFYYRSALTINQQKNFPKFAAINYLNIGNTLQDMKQIDSAHWYYGEALRRAENLDIIWVVAAAHEGNGNCLVKLNRPAEARQEFLLGLDAAKAFGNKELIFYLEAGLAEAYMGLGQLDSARAKWKYCMDSATFYQYNFLLSQLYLSGGKIFEASGELIKANQLYKAYAMLRDSLAFEQNAVIYRNFEERLRQEEKDHEEELKQQVAQEEADAENRRNKIILIFTSVVLLLSVSLGLFAYRSYRLKKKSHESLELQKDIIEEKNNEILSSIAYAQRLQTAILPAEKTWKQHFSESFIFYRPKDIVAGDFYWMESNDDTVFFAVADCTGHGVPGALVSVVCSNALNRAIHEFNLASTGLILDKVATLVTETFEKSDAEVYDGMDISICAFNLRTRQLEWSGANLPLWIYRNLSASIEEIKPDKQPIGKFDLRKPFTSHSVALNSGDVMFLFSDGYADQFGGPKGKKFKYKSLQDLLRRNAVEPVDSQKEHLIKSFDAWRGNLEQVDDVCVIGIRF